MLFSLAYLLSLFIIYLDAFIVYKIWLALYLADESYAEALLVLEQGLSSYQSQDPITENSKGMLLLAISSLLNERFGGEVFKAVSFLTSVARIVLETTAFFFFFLIGGMLMKLSMLCF